MRTLVVLLLLSSLLAAGAPTASGQDGSSPEGDLLVADPEGDVVLRAAPSAGVPPQDASSLGSFDHLDILELSVGSETDEDFQLTLRMKALESSAPPGPAFAGAIRYLTFSYGNVDWRLFPFACGRGLDSEGACLAYTGRGLSGGQEVAVAVNGDAYVFTIAKEQLFDEHRVPARVGRSITNLTAVAVQTFATVGFLPVDDPVGGASARDQAPDEGTASYTFREGGHGRGALDLSSPAPIRVSNGEATTLVFRADLANLGAEPLSVELSVEDTPDDWSVRVPALVEVPAGATVTLPVIAAVPFTHAHGETASFRLVAQALEDPDSGGELPLGVWWTEVPQPSAHHGGLQYFHSAPRADQSTSPFSALMPQLDVWFNTAPEDTVRPDTTDENVPATINEGLFRSAFQPGSSVPPEHRTRWFFPLAPSLLIGLDFDLTEQGLASFDIIPEVPGQGTVTARLLYCDPERGGLNAGNHSSNFCQPYSALVTVSEGTATGTLTEGQPTRFDVPLPIAPDFDLIPYAPGANIALGIALETDTPQNVFGDAPQPRFVTDAAVLSLPLLEYHDPVEQAFRDLGSLSLSATGPTERRVNPGETVLFHVDLASRAEGRERVALEFQGVNREWARVVGPAEFDVASGATRNVTVAVAAPADAREAQSAELFLVAQDAADPLNVAVLRLRAAVTNVEDLPDEAALAQGTSQSEKAPAAGLLAVAALAAIALRRRR